MVEKYIDVLKKQKEKLDSKDFNLESWKSATIVIIERIFGRDTEKIKQLGNIKSDFSSWSLRDASGSITPAEARKRRARDIIEASITELEHFGMPDPNQLLAEEKLYQHLLSAFKNELTGNQLKQIKDIVLSQSPAEAKKEKIGQRLKHFGIETTSIIIANLLSGETGTNMFKEK